MISPVLPVYERFKIDISHAKGVYIFDKQGNAYIDASAGYAALSLGHCPEILIDALTNQAHKVWHLSNKFEIPGLHDYSKNLVKLSEFAASAFIANSGAEAVECALKMARRYFHSKGMHNKYRIITFEGAFHGRTIACSSAAGGTKIEGFEPALDGFDQVKWNDLDAVRNAITNDTCAIFLELIQGEGGIRPISPEVVAGIEKLAKKYNLLIIIDEVQSGMGRTGKLFAYQYYNIKPDIVALGKGLGGGFPISACLATYEVSKAMKKGSHGSTFGGNPLALSVASKCLEEIANPAFLQHVQIVSAYLKEKVDALKTKYPNIIKDVRGCGLMIGIELHKDFSAEDASLICLTHYLISTPASNNSLRVTPPLILTQSHCDEILDKFDKVFKYMNSGSSMLVRNIKKVYSNIKKSLFPGSKR